MVSHWNLCLRFFKSNDNPKFNATTTDIYVWKVSKSSRFPWHEKIYPVHQSPSIPFGLTSVCCAPSDAIVNNVNVELWKKYQLTASFMTSPFLYSIYTSNNNILLVCRMDMNNQIHYCCDTFINGIIICLDSWLQTSNGWTWTSMTQYVHALTNEILLNYM